MSCFIQKEQKYPWNLDKMEMWNSIHPFSSHLCSLNGFTLIIDYLQTQMKYKNI